jgi:glucokinase
MQAARMRRGLEMGARTLIGVDLGGTNVRAGRVEGLAVAAHEGRPISAHGSAGQVLDEVMAAIEAVWRPDVAGIGIGVPSIVDVARGIVYVVQNIPAWHEVHLKALLEERFKVPAYVNNDANCFALGELHYGHGRGLGCLVGLVSGTGLGAGIITHGRLHAGANCGAGEIGCLPWREATVEHYVSGTRFLREHGISGAVLQERADRGDAEARRVFADFGRDFAFAVQVVLYAYDPEMIVLGGSCAKAYHHWEAAMRAGLRDFAYGRALERLRIEVSREPHIAILGAAALCHDAG